MALLSHLFRTLRWIMIIEPLGKKPGLFNTYMAILVMYIANFAFPRMGEVSRCGVLKKFENISFTKLLGTVLVERSVDFLILVLLFVAMFLTQFGVLQRFLDNNPNINGSSGYSLSSWNIYLCFGIILLFIFLFIYILKKKFPTSWLYKKISKFIKDFFEGIKAIIRMKRKGLFILYTCLIYLFYFLMTYVVFFSFDFTNHLGFNVAFSLLVMGSIGIMVVQGGIGAYHFLAVETLFIYGIDKIDGQVFALVMHGGNTIGQVIVGFLAFIILPLFNRRRNIQQ